MRCCHVRVLRAEDLLSHGHGSPIKWLDLRIVPLWKQRWRGASEWSSTFRRSRLNYELLNTQHGRIIVNHLCVEHVATCAYPPTRRLLLVAQSVALASLTASIFAVGALKSQVSHRQPVYILIDRSISIRCNAFLYPEVSPKGNSRLQRMLSRRASTKAFQTFTTNSPAVEFSSP